MAEIRPLRAWRYNPDILPDIDSLTSPLFDVVSMRQREVLYQNPNNSIHISEPLGDNPALTARKTLDSWKKNKIIIQDPIPGIYVYYQYFTLAGEHKELCRKGFIVNIKTYPWDDKVILRHENTMPGSVNDRMQILKEMEFHASPTHGLYTDPGFSLEKFMDESMLTPIYETEDYQGVREVMSVIHDENVINRFVELLKDKQVILADGHHRYEGSLAYKQKCLTNNPNHTGNEAYNYHFMYLTNTELDDLRILPTHRLILGLPNFDEVKFLAKLSEDFTIKTIEDAFDVNLIIQGKKAAFGLLISDNAYKLRLKEGKVSELKWNFPDEIKNLDLTILHYFIIEKALGIPGKDQAASKYIQFDKSFPDCLTRVINKQAQMAIITQDIAIDDVKKVCYSGYTLPPKATYFFPKVICGFLFSSIKENEFELYPDSWI
jgi:uncharacterized protein (DUF1015 family)